MTLDINWGALQAPDIGGAFNQGLAAGQQRRREIATDNALRALIANPNDPNVVNTLAKTDPRMAYQIQGQQQAAQRAAAEAAARQGAVAGDPQAMQQLAGFNLDDYLKLDKASRDHIKQGLDTVGQLALMADTPEKWDSIVGQLAQQDPQFQQYIGKFQMRDSIIAQAGLAKEAIALAEPKYQVIPEGGMLVNTRDPAALAQIGGPDPYASRGIGAESGVTGQYAPQGGATDQQAASIIADARQSKVITPEDFSRIQQALGPNGQQAAQRWMQENGIQIGKQINGKTYVQRGGEWYEVN